VAGHETAAGWIREAHAARLPVSVHALYADDVTEAVDLFEGLDGVPHRLVHAYEIARSDVPRISDLRLTVEAQPWDTVAETGAAPWRALLDAGVRVEFGSDWRDANLEALDPLAGVRIAVEQGLTREEALAAYTRAEVAAGSATDLVAFEGDEVILTLCAGRETYRR